PDFAAAAFDDALVLFHKRIDLLRRDVLPGKEHVFVKCHVLPFFSRRPADPAAKASATYLPAFAGEERRIPRRSRAETRAAESLLLRCVRKVARTSVQPRAVIGGLRAYTEFWSGCKAFRAAFVL